MPCSPVYLPGFQKHKIQGSSFITRNLNSISFVQPLFWYDHTAKLNTPNSFYITGSVINKAPGILNHYS